MRELLGRLTTQLKLHEGYSRTGYRDSVGKLTVGYGRNLDDVGLSIAEAEFLLQNDIAVAYRSAHKYAWFRLLSEPRKGVITDMIFNLGEAGFAKFEKMHSAIENGNHGAVSREMLSSKWAKQVKSRATRLAKQWKEDAWQM